MRIKTLMAVMLAATLLVPATALAHTPKRGSWCFNIILASVHTAKWAREQINQRNPGIGITYPWSRTWAIVGGMYQNLYRRTTWYGLAEWTPLHAGCASLGGYGYNTGRRGERTYPNSAGVYTPNQAQTITRVETGTVIAIQHVAIRASNGVNATGEGLGAVAGGLLEPGRPWQGRPCLPPLPAPWVVRLPATNWPPAITARKRCKSPSSSTTAPAPLP